jgi:hypothetical protein
MVDARPRPDASFAVCSGGAQWFPDGRYLGLVFTILDGIRVAQADTVDRAQRLLSLKCCHVNFRERARNCGLLSAGVNVLKAITPLIQRGNRPRIETAINTSAHNAS